MTDNFLSNLISGEVDKMMDDNRDAIISELASCFDQSEIVDDTTILAMITAIKLSTRLSTQYMVRVLENLDVIHLTPDDKPFLY